MSRRTEPLLRYLERPSRARLARVVHAWHAFVWKTAYRVTGHRSDAADVTQEVFLDLLVSPPRAEDVRAPAGWLAAKVFSRAFSHRRARERRARREREAYEQTAREIDESSAPDDEILVPNFRSLCALERPSHAPALLGSLNDRLR